MIDFDTESDLTPQEMHDFMKWFESHEGHGHWISFSISGVKGPCCCGIGIRGYFEETKYVHGYANTFREAAMTAYLEMWNKIGNEREAIIQAAALKLIELTYKEGKGVHVSKLRMTFKSKIVDANLMEIMLRAEAIADSGPFVIVGDSGNGAPMGDEDHAEEVPF